MQNTHIIDNSCPGLFVRIVLAALVPLSLSIAVMSYGCPLGIPGRLPFDAVNLGLLASYAVSVKRITRGTASTFQSFGLSRPCFRTVKPGEAKVVFFATLKILIPGGLVLALLMIGMKPYVDAMDNIVVTVTSRVGPMYALAAAWGSFVQVRRIKRRSVSWDT